MQHTLPRWQRYLCKVPVCRVQAKQEKGRWTRRAFLVLGEPLLLLGSLVLVCCLSQVYERLYYHVNAINRARACETCASPGYSEPTNRPYHGKTGTGLFAASTNCAFCYLVTRREHAGKLALTMRNCSPGIWGVRCMYVHNKQVLYVL